MSIVVNGLTKIYGNQKALNEISFHANKGEILGLLGPNGAGKTTTMKILSCFIPPTYGTAEVCGLGVGKSEFEIRRLLGYLPEHNPLYGSMYVKEYLKFVCQIHKLTKPESRISEVIEETGINDERYKRISELSKGYKQRVGLAQAIIHNPEVLILDEPISGLDPNQLVEIRSLIGQLKKNKTIIFSSHILQEVQSICDRIVILDKGNVVTDQKLHQLTQLDNSYQDITVEFLNAVSIDILNKYLKEANISINSERSFNISYSGQKDVRESVFDLAVKENNKILELKSRATNLENIFKSVTKKK